MTIRPSVLALLGVLAVAGCRAAETPAVDSAIGTGPDTALDTAAAPGAAPDTAGDTATAPAPLTADGWGPLRIGMTRDEVVAAAGADANPGAVGGPEPEQCDQFRPARAPAGVLVMLVQGRLARISLQRDSPVRTDRGLGVGDPASAVRAAYGPAATALPHKYASAPAEYLTVWTVAPPAPEARGIRYEIGTDGRVTHVHAGGPSIEYVEGCL